MEIKLNGRVYKSGNAKVGNLKKFLDFQERFERDKSLDCESIEILLGLICDIFPKLKLKTLEDMPAKNLTVIAQEISAWLGAALGSAEKNMKAP